MKVTSLVPVASARSSPRSGRRASSVRATASGCSAISLAMVLVGVTWSPPAAARSAGTPGGGAVDPGGERPPPVGEPHQVGARAGLQAPEVTEAEQVGGHPAGGLDRADRVDAEADDVADGLVQPQRRPGQGAVGAQRRASLTPLHHLPTPL